MTIAYILGNNLPPFFLLLFLGGCQGWPACCVLRPSLGTTVEVKCRRQGCGNKQTNGCGVYGFRGGRPHVPLLELVGLGWAAGERELDVGLLCNESIKTERTGKVGRDAFDAIMR